MRIVLFLLILLVAYTPDIYSKDAPTIISFRPGGAGEYDLEQEIKGGTDSFKNSSYYNTLLEFLAVRDENPGLCAPGSRNYVDALLVDRYTAEGRCEKISDPAKKEFCEALKSNNCGSLSSKGKDYCQGMLNSDVNAMVKARMAVEKSKGKDAVTDGVMFDLGIFWGYKYYSQVACERYANNSQNSLGSRLSCSILFSGDGKRGVDDIARDMAIFEISRKKADIGICENIKNSGINKACRNSAYKSLKELFPK